MYNLNQDCNAKLADLDRDWYQAIKRNDYELEKINQMATNLVTIAGLEIEKSLEA